MDDDAQIRRLVSERCAAMTRGDAQAIVDQYIPDAVVFSLAPPLRQPKDGTRDVATLQKWLDEKGGSVGSEVRDLEVTVGGDVAFCTGLERMGAPEGGPGGLWQWRIAHEHTSTPFYMDGSMRAAVDLLP